MERVKKKTVLLVLITVLGYALVSHQAMAAGIDLVKIYIRQVKDLVDAKGEVDAGFIAGVILSMVSFSPKNYSEALTGFQMDLTDARKVGADDLSAYRNVRSVDLLISALEDENAEVRGRAARTLGAIGDPSAVAPLISALQDGNPDVRKVAAEALDAITGEDFGEDAVGWENWWKRHKTDSTSVCDG